MFGLLNKKKAIDEENKKEEDFYRSQMLITGLSQNKEEIKSQQEKEISKKLPENSFNNIDYKLPDISIIDNERIKELINNKSDETIIPLGICDNNYYYESLESMPNLIVGGTVMSGKSSFIHTIIGTILLSKKPCETKLLICDSKLVEYNQYNYIPHLMCPIASDLKQISILLKKMVEEIDKRYHILESTGTKNTEDYKKYVEKWNNTHPDEKKGEIPSIIIIIDDYDMISDITIDDNIAYIAKKGWRVNIHIIIVSTYPSSEIISSKSKSLFPARLCFKVTSSRDSMLILDNPIASKLAGIGRAAYVSRAVNVPKQLDVIILNDEEIKRITDFVKSQQEANYDEGFINPSSISVYDRELSSPELDELFDEVVELVVSTNKASASMIQRRFKVGYNRAGQLIDQLEEQGVIRKPDGSNNWEVVGRPIKK